MRKLLITGGTVFVSRSLAEYFVAKGDEVYVLNRNNRVQSEGVHLIEADRYQLGDVLSEKVFDVVIDANSYTKEEVSLLVDALPSIKDYIFISTSAVYPETLSQPFLETQSTGENHYWKSYGTNKIEAEEYLKTHVPQAYILRPAYIYGPYNNAYREAFVFDCARQKRPFYLPGDGKLPLQFIHIKDVCRLVEKLLETHPEQKIYNVGNEEVISVREWVELCYEVVGEKPEFIEIHSDVNPTKYFSFTDYAYVLDVSRQMALLGETRDLGQGIKESWLWYKNNEDKVNKRNYIQYIEEKLSD